MRYLIDSGNQIEIDRALEIGAVGVTANPSLYLKEEVNFYNFIKQNNHPDILLTAEVVGDDLSRMIAESDKLIDISADIIIKLNYSPAALKLAQYLKKKKIKTAMTLLFDVNQALLALSAGVDYLFLFVARNEDMGIDGVKFIKTTSEIIEAKGYKAKIVAASVRNKFQLESVAQYSDYIAAPYKLIEESFKHPLTNAGKVQFEKDMEQVHTIME